MLHGFGGSKLAFEGPKPAGYNAMELARKGYAVVLPSARGFGRSCGVPDSRTAGCERGWIHLDDQRYEARDVQWLLGKLVDQLVARPDELGVTGISYGGGTTMQLAMLADRIRRPDGVTESWQSPDGVPLHIAAAWARWPWSDLADALQPNGRLGLDTYASPVGVEIQAYVNALYALANTTRLRRPARRRPRRGPHRLEPAPEQGRALRRRRPRHPQADPHLPRRARAADRQGDHAAAHPVGLDRRPVPRRAGPADLRPAAPEEQDARRWRCSSATSATRARPTTPPTSRPSTPRAWPSSRRA